MFFTKYLLATAAVQMLDELPNWKFLRPLRTRARKKRIARMKEIRAWHIAELKRIDVTADPKRWWWHRAQLRRLARAHGYREQEALLRQFDAQRA